MAKTNHWGALAAAAGTLVAVGLVVLIMMVVEAGPAGATFPGKNGKIAYSGEDPNASDRYYGEFEIYTIDPGGGGKVQLTNNNTDDDEPSYSPDGKQIAYGGDDGNDREIYTISAGGGTRVKVTNNNTNDFEPSWGSPIAVGIKPGPPAQLSQP